MGDGHEIVVRRDEDGAWALTSRNMVLVPAPLRRRCGYDVGDPVLVVAMPSMSAVVLHPLESLDQVTTASSPTGVSPITATALRVRQVRVMAVGSTQADVQALVQLMHVEPEEVLAAARQRSMPTFEEFMPLVRAATSPGLQASYGAGPMSTATYRANSASTPHAVLAANAPTHSSPYGPKLSPRATRRDVSSG